MVGIGGSMMGMVKDREYGGYRGEYDGYRGVWGSIGEG